MNKIEKLMNEFDNWKRKQPKKKLRFDLGEQTEGSFSLEAKQLSIYQNLLPLSEGDYEEPQAISLDLDQAKKLHIFLKDLFEDAK